MIVIDTDVAVDIRRGIAPAVAWFDGLPGDQVVVIPGFAAMELIYGTRDAHDLRETELWLSRCRIVWPEGDACHRAYQSLISIHLRNAIGLLDVLVGQVAISLDLPLYTFNQKHYDSLPNLKTLRPYTR